MKPKIVAEGRVRCGGGGNGMWSRERARVFELTKSEAFESTQPRRAGLCHDGRTNVDRNDFQFFFAGFILIAYKFKTRTIARAIRYDKWRNG